MADLEPTQIISGTIDRISNRGSGMLDYGDGEIRIGPVKPDAVETEATAVVHSENFALCLTETARAKYYDNTYKAMTKQLADDPPDDCPSPGDTIKVELNNVNSSGHGNAEYKGIRVRVRHAFATDREVTTGEPESVKVIRIEPDRIVASAVLSLEIRDQLPAAGEQFSAKIVHRSHSGRGLVESFSEDMVNIGPVTEDAVGHRIDAVMLDNKMAYCLSSSLVSDNYREAMQTHVTDKAVEDSDELSSIFRESVVVERKKVGSGSVGYRRNSTFSKRVKEAYDYACAVCGADRTAPNGSNEVEAAHIYPVAGADDGSGGGGPDAVENGIALCKLHHWAFDNGWFTLEDDYTVVVRDEPQLSGYEDVARYADKQIRIPSDEAKQPDPQFIQAHRTQIWK